MGAVITTCLDFLDIIRVPQAVACKGKNEMISA
jgi:hypothetical protein